MLVVPTLLLAPLAFGEDPTPSGYILPPKAILEACLAPWWTNVTGLAPSPDGTKAIVVDRDGPPPLAWLAKPYVNLGGVMIDTGAARDRSLTTRSAAGLRVMDLSTGVLKPISIPFGSRVSDAKWSPDGRTIAFALHNETGTRLFLADPISGRTHGLGNRLLLPTLCTTWEWTQGGKAIAAVFRPSSFGKTPVEPAVATAPRVQLSDEKKTALRTYPAILKTAYDATLLEYFATGQLGVVDAGSGQLHEVGKPLAIKTLDASPDGRAFRISFMEKPYSFLMPASSFPEREVIVDADGKELYEVRKQGQRTGSEEEDEQGRPGGPAGEANARRSLTWRPDGSLVFLRSGQGPEVGRRIDRVMTWPFPYTKDTEKSLYETDSTISSVRFSADAKTLFLTLTTGAAAPAGRGGARPAPPPAAGAAAASGSKLVALRDGKVVTLRETKSEDKEASNLVLNASGDVKLTADGSTAFLSGTQTYDDPTKEAPRPFLEKVSVVDGTRTRIWQSSAEKYETATLLDSAGEKVLMTRQSPIEVPQSIVVNLNSKTETVLTKNRDFAPDLTLAKRETFTVTRPDGFKFQVKVTSPAAAYRPPAFFWIYPSEFESQEAYDKSKKSLNKNLFTQVGGSNKQALIRLGYAVVEPDVPVVAAKERMNDTYVPQLRNSLSTIIDELDRRNLVDRARLGIGGHSYGAFSTVNAMVNTPFFKCGIAGDGCYLRPLTPFGFQSDSRQLWEARSTYLEVSPLLYADQLTGALLLYHSMDDQNIGTAPINSERMFTALEALGKPAELAMYPYEDHGPIAKETVLDQWARFTAWLDKYLKK